MTTWEAVTPEPAIERDRWGRPLVIPPNGGRPVAYTRCTTFVDALEDKYNLQKWQNRMTAIGLADRPDLLLAVNAHRDDKRKLDGICSDAQEAAKAHAKATVGTALHALTEQLDRGAEIPTVPEAYVADLAAYTEATKDLQPVHIERFCVLDSWKIGGTPDRVVKYKGKHYIADLKTGTIEYGMGKIAMQLAVYARSMLYDVATGERTAHDAEIDKGIVIHLPAGQGKAELYWVDLLAGWEGVRMARWVRDWRKRKAATFAQPFTDLSSPVSAGGGETAIPTESTTGVDAEPTLADRIAQATTAQQIRELWAAHASEWNDSLTEASKARIAAL